MSLKVATDHGWPKESLCDDAAAFDAFKNEREYIAQSGNLKTTVAAMDWAVREIERLREALLPFANFADKAEQFVEARAADNGSPIMPVNDFRLADFRRARSALSAQTTA